MMWIAKWYINQDMISGLAELELHLRWNLRGLKGNEIIVRGFIPLQKISFPTSCVLYPYRLLLFPLRLYPSSTKRPSSIPHSPLTFRFGHDPSNAVPWPQVWFTASNAPVSLSASSINGVEVTELTGYVPFFTPATPDPLTAFS